MQGWCLNERLAICGSFQREYSLPRESILGIIGIMRKMVASREEDSYKKWEANKNRETRQMHLRNVDHLRQVL